ncbi:MAG: peptidase [Nitrosopumilaceae archaeon]
MVSYQTASAQFQQGGVDHPGTWYVGEGFKKGDQFSYRLCHVDYKECADFKMDFWVEGDLKVGTETKWLVQAVVYDGKKIVKGNIELGKVAPEPTGGSPELSVYRGAFKTSIVWLSAFASADSPKAFSAKSWGKIGNIGGEQILPLLIEPNGLTVPEGHFDEVIQVGWRTGGANSKVWIVDGFPFPIKASTWTHVSEGIPPQEYRFELLDYKENVSTNPFANIIPTSVVDIAKGCPNTDKLTTSIKKPTKNFDYQVHVFYAPENPVQGCPMTWQIKFISKYDDTEFLNQVQYDLLVVDENLNPLRSIAQEENRLYLYSPSGQALLDITVNETPGTAHYVVWIYGLAPTSSVPSTSPDYLQVDIPISAGSGTSPPPPPPTSIQVPSWIQTTAGFWVDGFSSDDEFVNAIEFLINEGVIVIPPTASGGGTAVEIPSWIKTTTGYWVDGFTSDKEFVTAIQWLIENGIMKIA